MPPPIPKPEPRKKAKARAHRAESKVIAEVRPKVSARDGYCRLFYSDRKLKALIEDLFGPCSGPSEWAHLNDHRRSATRGLPPEERHTTFGSAMLCRHHHWMEEAHKLRFAYLTNKGADGLMSCTSKRGVFEERPLSNT